MIGIRNLSLGKCFVNFSKFMNYKIRYSDYEKYYSSENSNDKTKLGFDENQGKELHKTVINSKTERTNYDYPVNQINNKDGVSFDQSPDLLSMPNNYDVSKRLVRFEDKKDHSKFKKIKLSKHLENSNVRLTGEILFGIHPVLIALQEERRQFKKLFLKVPGIEILDSKRNEIEQLAKLKNVPIHYFKREVLDRIVKRPVHQGVCAEVSFLKTKHYRKYSNISIQPSSPCLWLVLESIQDPMNMGAILRTSYFLGVEQIFCSYKNSCALSPFVSKASSGALELMDIWSLENIHEFLQDKKSEGWHIIGTGNNNNSDTNVTEFDLKQPTILVLGNEGLGLPQNVLDVCQTILTIQPTSNVHSSIDSLNVSVAAGIILQALLSKINKNK